MQKNHTNLSSIIFLFFVLGLCSPLLHIVSSVFSTCMRGPPREESPQQQPHSGVHLGTTHRRIHSDEQLPPAAEWGYSTYPTTGYREPIVPRMPPVHPTGPRPTHFRSSSWNSTPPVMMGYSPSTGNPLIPALQPDGTYSQVRAHGRSSRRQKSYSLNAAAAQRMAFFGQHDLPPPPPSTMPPPPQRHDFSPRRELLTLTKTFRTTPPASPSSYRPPLSPNYNRYPTEADTLLQEPRPTRKMHMRQRSAQLYMQDIKGIKQIPACRDVCFALLFFLHLVGMVGILLYYYRTLSRGNDDDRLATPVPELTLSYRNILYVACLSGGVAMLVSTCTLIIMMYCTKQRIVQLALFTTIAMSFVWGTIGIGLSPKNFVPITGIIALALSVAYAFVVWDRIPFASANLHAGLTAIRANPTSLLVAVVAQALALGWTLVYTLVVLCVYDAMGKEWVLTHHETILVYGFLAVSYYWTFHVLMNVVQVTIAGTIGSWWFQPDDCEPRYQDVAQALFQASVYSFGSICFGSLCIGPVRFIKLLSAFVRPAQEESPLICLHLCVHYLQRCISNCVDSLSDRFNPWAITYVGLYGYSLLTAGSHATELFQKRGWTTIVSDDLVSNVLFMFSLVLGGLTGCFAMLLQNLDRLTFSNLGQPVLVAFLIGLVVGLVLTSVLFAIISSSVNAVVVCFTGSPLEFEENHPELSSEMRHAWREVWPGCMDVVDFQVGHLGAAFGRSGGYSDSNAFM